MVKEKYSVGEFERRFLLDAIPDGVTNRRKIVDLYIEDTRLRLRQVGEEGMQTDWKLGHKRRVEVDDPTAIMHTSLYLDEREAAILARLPAHRLVKTRWAVEVDGHTCSVNVFEERLAGLILLEVDVEAKNALGDFNPPSWAGVEVTTNEAFTGGRLAQTTTDDLETLLASVTDRR